MGGAAVDNAHACCCSAYVSACADAANLGDLSRIDLPRAAEPYAVNSMQAAAWFSGQPASNIQERPAAYWRSNAAMERSPPRAKESGLLSGPGGGDVECGSVCENGREGKRGRCREVGNYRGYLHCAKRAGVHVCDRRGTHVPS